MTQENLTGKNVLLIDGSGYIYRAFYALPSMTRQDGTPTNAVYGFCAMMMKLIKEKPADYIAVIFDSSRETFRMKLYPEYKATRKETPEELKPQFPLLREAVEAFNLAQAEMIGFEADDLLATYARIAHKQGAEVTIVSADKDLMQLVGSGVTLFDPMKNKKIEAEQVLEKFGVLPHKVIDVQALAGDTSDNVPGVRGIGIKTAASLITDFGSLENLLENTHTIKQPKRRQMLEEDKELALISKQLVTLKNEVPVEKEIHTFKARAPELKKIEDFFDKMEFRTLKSKIPTILVDNKNPPLQAEEKTPPPPVVSSNIKTEYSLIQTTEELQKQLQKATEKGLLAIDTETDSLDSLQAKMVGFSFAYEEGKAFYVPLRHALQAEQTDFFSNTVVQAENVKQIPLREALEILKPVLENQGVLKIGHNLKYDWHIFENEMGEVKLSPFDDTMVLSYVLDSSLHRHNMDDLAELFLNHVTIKYSEVCGTGRNKITFDKVELEKACAYASEDADITLRLHSFLKQRLVNEHFVELYEKLDKPCINVLFEMERNGVHVNPTLLQNLSIQFGKKLGLLEEKIIEMAGEEFNLNSPIQLGKILFEKLGLPESKKSSKTKAWSTDASVLESLAESGFEIAQNILEYRQFSKLKSTYTDALQKQINPQTKRVHTTFAQTITATGRLSSTDPNLQNIPIRQEEGRLIRTAFIAEKGKVLISADYSQVELRLMAHVADVKNLKEAFEQNMDIHAATASQIFNTPVEGMDPMLRRSAKAINFGIIYGISAFGLSNQLGIERKEAQNYIDSYFEKYPEIKTYMQETIQFAKENGFVMTPFGRKCAISGMNDKNGNKRQFAERSAINAPIQGGAADIIKKAMIELPLILKEKGLKAKLLLQVHDELIVETPLEELEETKQVIKDVMENVYALSVPLIADVGFGENWAEAH